MHVADNILQPERGQKNYDKLDKIRLLLDYLSKTYKHYLYGELQATDESMVIDKGSVYETKYASKAGKTWI